MKLLFASDSFKGSLSSEKTQELLTAAAKEVFGEVECSGVPVADGGEGTVDAVIAAEKGELIHAEVYGPLMDRLDAAYGRLDDHRAVIEMAAASGLPLIPRSMRNPLYTTSYGTGELIRDALDRGFRDILPFQLHCPRGYFQHTGYCIRNFSLTISRNTGLFQHSAILKSS